MPKYWEGNYFAQGSKKRRKKRRGEREREKERLNDGNKNGQATHGAHKHAWCTQAAWANIMDQLYFHPKP